MGKLYRTSLLICLAVAPDANCVWPIPHSMQTGSAAVTLASDFDIKPEFSGAPGDLTNAIAQTKSYLQQDKFERLVVGRGSSDDITGAPELHTLHLSAETAKSISEEATVELGSRDESYELSIPSDGSDATITANTTLGLFRGLTTFSSLFYYKADGEAVYTIEAPIKISDAPAYPYRGLMLDTSRNFYGTSDILRTLDAMSWAKLNTLHWHVTDSQSFPLGVAEFPELAAKGAYSASEIYSTGDVQTIVKYAAARGIDVLMEIDSPGHSAAIALSHPEHIACASDQSWITYNGEPPFGQIRVASEATMNFSAALFSDVAKTLLSKYMSTGGDEIVTTCYDDDPQTQEELKASGQTFEQAFSVFTQATHGALHAAGKTPVVWEEMVLEHNVTLSNDTIVTVWISSANAKAVADKGFRIIHGPSDYFYLDCGAGEWLGNTPNATSWCDPFKSWQKAYTFDPLASLTAEQTSLVLGGQQLLWSEQSGPDNLDSIVWPRAASSAEVFWSGSRLADGTKPNVTSALPRLHDLRYRMVQRGVKAIDLQPKFCALRPGYCVSS